MTQYPTIPADLHRAIDDMEQAANDVLSEFIEDGGVAALTDAGAAALHALSETIDRLSDAFGGSIASCNDQLTYPAPCTTP